MEEVWEVILSQTHHPIYFNQFYDDFILGKEDIFPLVAKHHSSLGFELETKSKGDQLSSNYGIIKNDEGLIIKIHPESVAYNKLMLGDIIKSKKDTPNGLELSIDRFGRDLHVALLNSEILLYKDYFLVDRKSNPKRDAWING